MADPFEVLRLPAVPVDPEPTFATRLRSRVERALSLPEGVTVSDLALETLPVAAPVSAGAGSRRPGGVTPYLIVEGASRAIDWYVSALGAIPRGEAVTMPDGRIGHAEMALRGSIMYLADPSPESHVSAPLPGADATVSFTLEVPDVDGTVGRALSEGALLERPLADNPYGRNAVIRDPFGHRWIISSMSQESTPESIRHGDVGYVSLWVPDVERAATFYSNVLGWSYAPQAEGHARQIVDCQPPHGIFGGQDWSTLFLCFVVDDIDDAVGRVRAAGGQADQTTVEPHGRSTMCVDVEGTPFSLYQPPAGARGRRLAPNGEHHGDLSYITMEVDDSAAVRAFYDAVLGWHFNPGRIEDGWGPAGVVPMTGLSGGHQKSTVVPMYRVDDIHAAVARVRSAGGSASDPEQQPYGISSECVDDQGTRFYLGQL